MPSSSQSCAGFGVEIVEHFQVVGDEADRHDDDVCGSAARRVARGGSRRRPARATAVRRAAAALIDELPVVAADAFAHQPARFAELRFVAAAVGHRLRNAVGGEHEQRFVAALGRNLGQRVARPLDHRLDEAGMIEEHAELVDLRRRRADLLLGAGDVFAILPAAGIRTERAGDERQRPLHAVGRHLPQRIGQQRMPVAIAPVDRQLRPVLGQFPLQRGDQLPILIVDRALAAEVVVVLGDFEHPLARHVAAAEHVFQKRQHVVRAVGPAEGDDEQRIVRRRRGLTLLDEGLVIANWFRGGSVWRLLQLYAAAISRKQPLVPLRHAAASSRPAIKAAAISPAAAGSARAFAAPAPPAPAPTIVPPHSVVRRIDDAVVVAVGCQLAARAEAGLPHRVVSCVDIAIQVVVARERRDEVDRPDDVLLQCAEVHPHQVEQGAVEGVRHDFVVGMGPHGVRARRRNQSPPDRTTRRDWRRPTDRSRTNRPKSRSGSTASTQNSPPSIVAPLSSQPSSGST